MTEEAKIENPVNEGSKKTRRTFVRAAAGFAVTAPAVGVLLSATTTPASAASLYGHNDVLDSDPNHTGDLGSGFGDNITGGPFTAGIDDFPPASP